MCFPIGRIAITIDACNIYETECPTLLIGIKLSYLKGMWIIYCQLPYFSSGQIYESWSMIWNGITDRAAFWVRRRQDRKGKNQNEYYGDDNQ